VSLALLDDPPPGEWLSWRGVQKNIALFGDRIFIKLGSE